MDPTEIPSVLGDDYTTEILAATDDPKSAREISEQLGVPIATCYRRVEDLVEADLLTEVSRELSDHGRRTSVYRRTVDDVTVSFENGEVTVSATERPPLSELRQRVRRMNER
jgi:predicted ArsR family transcriptional regulator